MTEYKLPNFAASKTWVKQFRDRHKLNLRVPHYERRQQINKDIVVKYLKQIEEGIENPRIDRIVKIEETFVMNNDSPIAHFSWATHNH